MLLQCLYLSCPPTHGSVLTLNATSSLKALDDVKALYYIYSSNTHRYKGNAHFLV